MKQSFGCILNDGDKHIASVRGIPQFLLFSLRLFSGLLSLFSGRTEDFLLQSAMDMQMAPGKQRRYCVSSGLPALRRLRSSLIFSISSFVAASPLSLIYDTSPFTNSATTVFFNFPIAQIGRASCRERV